MSDIIILTEGYIPPDRDYLKIMEGGQGSGNFGHAGRPGQRGGSGPGGGPPEYEDKTEQDYIDSQVDKELSGGHQLNLLLQRN